MKTLLVMLVLVSSPLYAATTLQICATTPTGGGLMGCPSTQVAYAPVAPTTLVRSIVNGQQGWRAFGTLHPTDNVYAQDGTWHALNTIAPALVEPSVVTPPPPPPPTTQTVVITSTDNPPVSVTFSGIPVPGCFTVNAKSVCVP